jgi:hypothetical protein
MRPSARPCQGSFLLGITYVDLGVETRKQLHQVLAPLPGSDQQRPLPACGACGGGVGVGAGLEEALGVLVLAQLNLRDERGLLGVGVLALECRCSGARDKTAFTAVLRYGPRTICLFSTATPSSLSSLTRDSFHRHFSLTDSRGAR